MSQNIFTHNIGKIRCTIISDGISSINADEITGMFSAVPEAEMRAAFTARFGAIAKDSFSMNILLIQAPERTILVDTGVGAQSHENAGALYDQLCSIVDPAAIDTIFLTHAHGDHFGGLITDSGSLTYPNAQVVMSRREWDFWMSAEAVAFRDEQYIDNLKKHLLPIQNRLTLLDGEQEIAPGIRTVDAPGHTPGHTGLLIESEGARLLHIVDSLHSPLQFEHPDWSPRFDYDPRRSAQTRRELMSRAVDEGLTVLAYHIAFPGLGTFSYQGNGFAWQGLSSMV